MIETATVLLWVAGLAFFGYNIWDRRALDRERARLASDTTAMVLDRSNELLESSARMQSRFASAMSEMVGRAQQAPLPASQPRTMEFAAARFDASPSLAPDPSKLTVAGRFATPPPGSAAARILDAASGGSELPFFPQASEPDKDA